MWDSDSKHVEKMTDKRVTWRPRNFISVGERTNPFFNLSNRCVETRCKEDVGEVEALWGPLEWHAGPHREGGWRATCM